MSDMDPCACIWDHNLAVQRLLSILRQSQAYCTDNECLDISTLPGPGNGSSENNFIIMCLLALAGMMLYAFRPTSMRSENGGKARDADSGSDGDPPLPPPAIN